MSLENLFDPEKVAVVGASRHEGKTGHEIFDNLLHSFEGEVYAVNPNAEKIEGEQSFDYIPEDTDLAVIAVPARGVIDVIKNCGGKNVDTAIVISSGFSETGNESLQSELEYVAEQNNVNILGPNVLGLINTDNGLNASFASKTPDKGDISFMSQSGAFCTAMLDYSRPEHLGFHHFVSLGNELMISEVDMLEKWREDETDVILSYVESIENGRKFIEEASKTSREKPVIMVKSGRTEEGGDAASSHTGSIAGSIDSYRAAFRKTGIIEAESNRELLELAKAFSFQPLPCGDKVAVVTNAGGPGVITADEVNERGLKLSSFNKETVESLEEYLPEEASTDNPVDIVGDSGHRRYSDALESVLNDEDVDSVIVILTPQANTQIRKTAHVISNKASETDKTVYGCFMGEEKVKQGAEILEEDEVPVVDDPKQAVKSLKAMNNYREFLETERSFLNIEIDKKETSQAMQKLEKSSASGPLLDLYGFDLALTETVESPQRAVESASRIGYPVALKIDSRQVSHKTDIGGVETDLRNRDEVQKAFRKIVENAYETVNNPKVHVQEQIEGLEIALGMKRDPQFGPVIMVGLGGIYVEAIHDVSFGIAPISEEEAEQMIHELRSSEIFEGVRGKQRSLKPIKQAIIRLGELSLNHSKINAVDINPLILNKDKAHVVDIDIELK